VDIEDVRKNGAYCQNCGKCLHEKDNDFSSSEDMTEQEKISEVIWKNRRK
jgi:transcription initiation factor IIE alpha subunit